MRNRAKCKKCNDIIESFHASDYVFCKCGEIALDGGDAMRCSANDWSNFLRVDDEGNEILVTVHEKGGALEQAGAQFLKTHTQAKPTRKEVLELVSETIKNYENLPQHALYAPVNHADLLSVLFLLSAYLRAEE